MEDIKAWFATATTKQQLGIMVPAMALKTWYSAGESTDALDLAFRKQGVGDEEIAAGAVMYVHMIYGDYPSFPSALRQFLSDSSGLVIPVLREYIRDRVQDLKEIPTGSLTIGLVDSMIGMTLFLWLSPKATQVAGAAMIDEFVTNRLQCAVIDVDVETAVRGYLASGEYPQRHPAHQLLRTIVELAPPSRLLPARAAALSEYLMELK